MLLEVLDGHHWNWVLLLFSTPYALAFSAVITALISWPFWFLEVRREAKKQQSSMRKFVASDQYDDFLRKYLAYLARNK